MPVFGRFDSLECVKFLAVVEFLCPSLTRRSLDQIPSIRFRLIIMDSSDDLRGGLIPEVEATSKSKSNRFPQGLIHHTWT